MSVGRNRLGWPASTRNPLKPHGFILIGAVCSQQLWASLYKVGDEGAFGWNA